MYNITTGRNIQKFQMDEAEKPRIWLHAADKQHQRHKRGRRGAILANLYGRQ